MRGPRAKKRPHALEVHGVRLEDPWAWLRDKEDPEVRAHLEAENAHTEEVLAPLSGLREQLYEELLGRVQEDDRSVPAKDGPYLYYWRTESGRPYVVYCRAPVEAPAREQVVLDVNHLAEGHDFTSLGAYEVSPSHRRLAYSVDHDGDERHVLEVVDLETGARLSGPIPDTSEDVAWIDEETLLYVVIDEAERPFRVLRHRLGDDPAHDEVLFEEPDPAFYVGVERARTGGVVFVGAGSATTSEVWFLTTDEPQGDLRIVRPRAQDVEYDVDHLGDRLFVRTNQDAFGFRLEAVPLEDPAAPPEIVVPERPGVTLEGFELYEGHLVWFDREAGLPKVRVRAWGDDEAHELAFEAPAYDVWTVDNHEASADTVRLVYTSLVEPPTTYAYALDGGRREVLRVRPVPGYDPARYVSERRWATAPDGTGVPISLVRHVDTPVDGRAALLVQGYGAYGMPYQPAFDADRVSLLDRGVIVAIAHVRGGGDLGRAWKEAGRLSDKPNTFADFEACVEHLVEAGYGSKDRVALEGRSAGGLLVGAVLNRRPELFRAGLAGVPFVDVTRTLLDETLPLTVLEWEEWGDPKDPEDFAVIHGYCPCENVRPAAYPDLLVTAGLEDPRVAYWEPAKWVQRLREAQVREGPTILLKTELGAGHGGRSGRYGQIEDTAFEQAFLLDRLGATSGGGSQ